MLVWDYFVAFCIMARSNKNTKKSTQVARSTSVSSIPSSPATPANPAITPSSSRKRRFPNLTLEANDDDSTDIEVITPTRKRVKGLSLYEKALQFKQLFPAGFTDEQILGEVSTIYLNCNNQLIVFQRSR